MITIGNKKKSFEKVTGLAEFEVVGFNLSLEQLAEHGVNLKKETEIYTTRENVNQPNLETKETEVLRTVDQFKINVWLKLKSPLVSTRELDTNSMQMVDKLIENPNQGQLMRVTYTLDNREWTSSKNWYKCYVNKVGKSRWGADLNAIAATGVGGAKFVEKKPVYSALPGLPNFYDFILAWTNIDVNSKDSEVMLGGSPDAIKTVFEKGNNTIIDELNGYAEALKGQHVVGLVGVSGNWQSVFSQFMSAKFTSNDRNRLEDAALDPKYGFKADFQDSLELKIFDPMANLSSNNSAPVANEAASTEGEISVEDLPF